ncbi:MAG TPA: hypothetical protein VFG00_11675 [Acidothermaceae bacterium]|nr:hypothetical protein [Acidothermaceae bacterium]
MNWILMNIPLGIVMVAFAAGLPAWVMWKFPDEDSKSVLTAAALHTSGHAATAAHTTHQQRATGHVVVGASA